MAPPRVIVLVDSEGVSAVLAPGYAFGVIICAHTADALRQLSDLRARSTPTVVVLARRDLNLPAVVMDLTTRYPEVPVVIATFDDVATKVPARAIGRPAGSSALMAAIDEALRVASQQNRVRTTLDRLNVKLRSAPGPDAQQERRLVLSGLYLGNILDQASDGIFVTDRSGRVALWNRAAAALFGRTEQAARGRCIDEIIAEPAGSRLLAAITAVSAVGGRPSSLALLLDSNGATRHIDVSLSLVCDHQGDGIAVSLIARDVTERHLLQVELQKRADALEQSNRHKDEFLAIVSHELRTPLNAVLGWTQILMTTAPDPERTRKALDMIARNAELQRRLVEDLLDYARMTAGRFLIRPEPTDLKELVRTTLENLRSAIEARGLRLSEHYAPAVVARVDRERIAQVVANLVGNATKFTATGDVKVTLQCVGQTAEICVADTGQGIAPEFLPHVFDQFRQADASTTRSESGLGLGLAIAQQIVRLHGGEIRAASEGLGKGAVFTVTLPVSDCGGSAAVSTSSPATAPHRATR